MEQRKKSEQNELELKKKEEKMKQKEVAVKQKEVEVKSKTEQGDNVSRTSRIKVNFKFVKDDSSEEENEPEPEIVRVKANNNLKTKREEKDKIKEKDEIEKRLSQTSRVYTAPVIKQMESLNNEFEENYEEKFNDKPVTSKATKNSPISSSTTLKRNEWMKKRVEQNNKIRTFAIRNIDDQENPIFMGRQSGAGHNMTEGRISTLNRKSSRKEDKE